MKLDEIVARQAVIKGELAEMEANGQATEEDSADLADSLFDEYDKLETRRKPLADKLARMKLIQAADDPGNLEPGSDPGRGPDLVVRNKRDPFDPAVVDEIRRGGERNPGGMIRTPELRERAFDAIEYWAGKGELASEFAETATRMVQDHSGHYGRGHAAHILNTGSPEYVGTFREYLENPQQMASRAALSLTLANGGYLLPFVLDPTIILTNASSANPWRRISNVKTTTSNTWNGVNSAGVTAAWLTEGSVAADASPTVANIVVTPQKAAAWVFGSYEVLEDT